MNRAGVELSRTDVRLKDLIKVYDDAVPPELCDEIIARFEQDTENHIDRNQEKERSFVELNLTSLPAWAETKAQLLESTGQYISSYQEDSQLLQLPEQFTHEDYRIKRYSPERNHVFGDHLDIANSKTAMRFMVLIWYLNDVQEGGETHFREFDVSVKPVKGRLLMFPPFWMYMHAGLQPISGQKYIVGTFLTYL